MASQDVYFTGKCTYAWLSKPDKYGKYSVNVYLDDWDKFDRTGIQLKQKEDDKGRYVVFKRAPQSLIKGNIKEWGPPKVVDKDNNELDPRRIGSGSTVTAKVVVYDSVKGKAHRLEAIRVEELVDRMEGQDSSLSDIEVPF